MVRSTPVEESDIKIGEYIFASRWGDRDWNDPWAIGFVRLIGRNFIEVANEDDSDITGVGKRGFRFFRRIDADTGKLIIPRYTEAEGMPFDEDSAESLFS